MTCPSGGPPDAGWPVESPAPRAAWEALLAATPGALPTQTPQWCDTITGATRWTDASQLHHLPSGRTVLLPLVRRALAPGVEVRAAWPSGWGESGLLADGGATGADVAAVAAHLTRTRTLRTSVVPALHDSELWDAAMPRRSVRTARTTHLLDARKGFAHVWSHAYTRDTRYSVRRAERHGVTVAADTAGELLPAFADLYRASVLRWAAQRRQPRAAALALARLRDRAGHLAAARAAMGDGCRLWVASDAGTPVAATVVLVHGEQAVGWVSAFDKEAAGRSRATYLLTSLAIEDACASGAVWFDMGESDPGSEVERWKARFGAPPATAVAHSLERLPLTAATRLGVRVAGAGAAGVQQLLELVRRSPRSLEAAP